MNRRSLLKLGALFAFQPSLVRAAIPFGFLSNPVSGGGSPCNTLQFDNSGAYDSDLNMGFYNWRAGSFTTVGALTICAAQLKLGRTNTLSGTLQAKIYTNNIASPGVIVGTGSSTVDVNSVTNAGEAYLLFPNMSVTLSAATVYWVILQGSSTFDRIVWVGHTGSGVQKGSTDGTVWDFEGNFAQDFKLFST